MERENRIVSTCRARTRSYPKESVGNQPCKESLLWLVNVCGGEEEETRTQEGIESQPNPGVQRKLLGQGNQDDWDRAGRTFFLRLGGKRRKAPGEDRADQNESMKTSGGQEEKGW